VFQESADVGRQPGYKVRLAIDLAALQVALLALTGWWTDGSAKAVALSSAIISTRLETGPNRRGVTLGLGRLMTADESPALPGRGQRRWTSSASPLDCNRQLSGKRQPTARWNIAQFETRLNSCNLPPAA
jgi:hypothetical protein